MSDLQTTPWLSRRFFPYLALLLCAALSSACGDSSGGGDDEDGDVPYPRVPANGQVTGEKNLANLMRSHSQGQARRVPWAGYWFPYEDQGTSSALAKYERASGETGAVSWEQGNHGSSLPGLERWWGHCNGWAAAAALWPEPLSQEEHGGVAFGIQDQKALLTELGMEVRADFFGRRHDSPGNTSSGTFLDVSPNQFFLVITNYIGTGLPVIVDRYTGYQVWNHPVAGYQMGPVTAEDNIGPDPSAPNVHRVRMSTRIWWVRDDVSPDHRTEPFQFQDGPSYESRVLRYELWLDGPPVFDSSGNLRSSGNVILARQGNSVTGGVWRNSGLEPANSHPDYIWVPHAPTPSTGFRNPRLSDQWVLSRFSR